MPDYPGRFSLMNNLPHSIAAGNALYASSRSNARLGLGDSGACAPALDTGDQCEMFVVRMWVRMLRILFIPHIQPGPGMGAGAGRIILCALVG